MTISPVTGNDIRPQFTGDNATTTFPFGEPVNADEDLQVTATDLTTLIDTVYTLNVEYTITGIPSGGPYPTGVTVNIVPAPDTNTQITLFRQTEQSQLQSYIAKSSFPSGITEQVLDKIIMIIQELEEKASLALQLAASATGISAILPLPDAGKALIWNPAEDALINSTLDVDSFGAALIAAQAAAAAAAIDAAAAAASAASVQSPVTATVQTTNATPTTLSTVSTTNNSVGWLKAEVVSKDAGANEGAVYRRMLRYQNNAGTLTLDVEDSVTLEEYPLWDFDLVVSGTDILLQVTGEAGKTIDWESETLQKELT